MVKALQRLGVTHAIGIPDNASAALFSLLQKHPAIQLLNVTREGEAFAIASGLWIGGKVPALIIQNTGLLESGDSLRGTAMRMGIPLLCLVTYRGYAKMARAGLDPQGACWDAEALQRADLDSAALLTQPTLNCWGVPFQLLSNDPSMPEIDRAQAQAVREERPVAVLIPFELEGGP